MALKLTDDNIYKAIADAIRDKLNTFIKYKPGDMANAISSINTEGFNFSEDVLQITSEGLHNVKNYTRAIVQIPLTDKVSGSKNITTNGQYDVSTYESIDVNVPTYPTDGTITIDRNHEEAIDISKYEKAIVNVPAERVDTGEMDIVENGTYDVIGKGFIHVNVPIEGADVSGVRHFSENTTSQVDVSNIKYVMVEVPPSAVVSGAYSINKNGIHDITPYKEVIVNVPVEDLVSGTKTIVRNGQFDVTKYKAVDINVPQLEGPEGNYTINANGTYDITRYETVTVNMTPYSLATGTKTITNNGTNIDVAECRTVTVDIRVENLCSGTKEINVNGEHNVVGYEKVLVQVPQRDEATGNINITKNGSYDIKAIATATVNVPPEEVVFGNLNIIENTGNSNPIDVSSYKTVTVNVNAAGVDSGTLFINKAGIHNAIGYAFVDVNIKPEDIVEGTKIITTNGIHDVTDYANVQVVVGGSSGSGLGMVINNDGGIILSSTGSSSIIIG